MSMEKKISKRVQWADNAKAISIIAVISAHTSLDYTWWGTFVSSFRIPVFLFVAGFFFSFDKYDSIKSFIRRKARILLLPYAVFAGGSYLLFLGRYHFGDSAYYEDLSVYKQFFGIFYSAGTRDWMDFNLPLWFLTFLFVVEVLFYVLRKRFRTDTSLIAVLALFSVIGYLDGLWNPYKLPWGIDVGLTGIVFYGAGHLLKDVCKRWLAKTFAVKLALGAVFLFLNIVVLTQRMNLNMKDHGIYLDFYFGAFCGIAWCLLLSSLVRSKVLSYLGENTLILLAVHTPILRVASRLVDFLPFPIHPYLAEAARVLITIILSVPVILLIRRYFPWILGAKGNVPNRRPLIRESEMTSPSNTTIT